MAAPGYPEGAGEGEGQEEEEEFVGVEEHRRVGLGLGGLLSELGPRITPLAGWCRPP